MMLKRWRLHFLPTFPQQHLLFMRVCSSAMFAITQGMITMVIVIGPFIVLGYGGFRLFRWYMVGKSVEVSEEPAAPI